jgi:hypothetical protein
MTDGADSLRGALHIKGGAERGQVQVAVDAAELLAGLDPADGAPVQLCSSGCGRWRSSIRRSLCCAAFF